MGDTWTKEQKAAIDTRNCNLLVAAAAGSGKTAVLVERIIKMLTNTENPVDIDRLLVVTFTNAAAAEMRERIGDAISKALEEDPHSKVLQRQLSLLSRASVTTIHSFCLNVIKSNYHLIDLDPGFRIADDAEISIIKDDIVSELLEDKYDAGDENFLKLIDSFANGKNDDSIKGEVQKLYRFVMSGPWPEKWLEENAKSYDIKNKNELNECKWVKSVISDFKPKIEYAVTEYEKLIQICDEYEWLNPYREVLTLDYIGVKSIYDAVISDDIEEVFKALFNMKFVTLKAIRKPDDVNLRDEIKGKRDILKKFIDALAKGIQDDDINNIISDLQEMYPIVLQLSKLTIEFKEKFEKKKREKNILDFNDIEHLCLKILVGKGFGTEKPFPSAVAKEFKEKFEEVLVDEYQDSSSIQETIIDMVSRRKDENPNAFMVGDVKQSIYKFRQAKPELFLDKYNTYSESDNSKNRKILLYANFRSRKEVLDSANYIFETLMSEKVGELDYDEKERLNLGMPYLEIEGNLSDDDKNMPFKNSTTTEFHIFDSNGISDSEINESSDSEEKDGSDEEDLEAAQYEGRIIARRIKEMISTAKGDNYVVWDKSLKKYRKLRYKDIVILLRATKSWSSGIVEELGKVGIPVYADTGTGYFETTEIRTIMSIFNIIDNPLQDIYMIAAMRSPIFSFTAEELGEIRLVNKEKYFYENIKTICNDEFQISEDIKEKCKYILDKIGQWRDRAEYTPIDELIWHIYTDTSYYGYVGAMPNGPQRQANLKILFQRAKQYEETSFKGVFNFINFIKKMRKSSSGDLGSAKILGENEDVVRIMSIHKSKGLEFPIVFVAGTGKQFNLRDLSNNILYHEKLGIGVDIVNIENQNKYPSIAKTAIKERAMMEILSEEMRILYVALTRAREKLIIIGGIKNSEKKFTSWYNAAVSSSDDKIDPTNLLKSKISFMDWIGIAMAKHPCGQIIRDGKEIINSGNLSKWDIKIWKKSDLLESENIIVESKEELEFEKNDINISRQILDRLNFKYKFNQVCNIPSNISVSDLKKKYISDEEVINLFTEEEIESFNDNDTRDVTDNVTKEDDFAIPSFMKEANGISSAQKGTIMHFVMQNVDFEKTTVSDIRKLVDRMVIKELLTDEEAKSVNLYKISSFFKSELGKRLLKAKDAGYKIYRELPFFREIKVIDLYEELDKEIYKDEMLRMQGIIDCFFEDEKGVVLIDYKTDFVLDGNEEIILNRYKIQIELYASTLSNILGKPVNEKFLYLFGLEKEVKY